MTVTSLTQMETEAEITIDKNLASILRWVKKKNRCSQKCNSNSDAAIGSFVQSVIC